MSLEWLSIEVILNPQDDGKEEITIHQGAQKRIIPRVGEYIWMPYDWERKGELGTRAFIVTDVAHHFPLEGTKDVYDSIVIYVDLVK